ncbi:MAG: SLC13 family permease [Pseudomonadota bacterium]
MEKPASILSALVLLAAAAIFFMPAPAGTNANIMHAGALLVLVIGLWAVGSLPEYLTGLIFFLLAMVLAIAPASVVFSGFASGTVWLVLGGLVIAEAVSRTGLGARFARFMLGRLALSYPALIVAVVIVSGALCFVMPATVARILLLLPIISALAERLGLARGGTGHNGVCLAMMMTNYHVGTTILPANAPNMVLAGSVETLYNTTLIYAEFLMVQFPVMAIAKSLLTFVLVLWLFPAHTTMAAERHADPQPLSAEEQRLTLILFSALALWATDFLHHINPGWIALGAGIACLMPRIGVIATNRRGEGLKLDIVIYLAAVIGLGAVVVQTGLNQVGAQIVLQTLDLKAGQDAYNFMQLSLLATGMGLVVTNVAQPALLAPLAEGFAQAVGWPLKSVLMTMAVGFSTMILPYQVPPMLVGMHVAGLRLRTMLRLCLPLAAVSLLVLLPLDYLWWRVIGYFG